MTEFYRDLPSGTYMLSRNGLRIRVIDMSGTVAHCERVRRDGARDARTVAWTGCLALSEWNTAVGGPIKAFPDLLRALGYTPAVYTRGPACWSVPVPLGIFAGAILDHEREERLAPDDRATLIRALRGAREHEGATYFPTERAAEDPRGVVRGTVEPFTSARVLAALDQQLSAGVVIDRDGALDPTSASSIEWWVRRELDVPEDMRIEVDGADLRADPTIRVRFFRGEERVGIVAVEVERP